MNKKLYTFRIEERNGDQEYSHDLYLLANNVQEASNFAREYASGFYSNGQEIEYDVWSNGYLEWELIIVLECDKICVYPINGRTISIPAELLAI